MRKLQKILMASVLVSIMVGIFAVCAGAAQMTAAKVLANYSGAQAVESVTSGSQRHTVSVASNSDGNKYYEVNFLDSGAHANFYPSPSGNYAFLGKGDYIVTEFDFMAEDWTTVKNVFIGWNSRNDLGGSISDMYFTFSNENGAPKVSGGPLAGSIVLDPTPGMWHHLTIVVQVGGEHTVNENGTLTARGDQDAVEAYAYLDGQLFASNLIGDGMEFWGSKSTYFQSLRMTAVGANQTLCIDNVYIAQYESTKELRDFFKYRQKNNGQFPDINETAYTFLNYSEDYDYPIQAAKMMVVEMNGNETFYDRFDRAAKYASSLFGAKIVLLSDIKNAEVNYPVLVDRTGYDFDYKTASTLRAEEEIGINPINGEKSMLVSFIKKTKYAYYTWEIDHTGEKLDARGYTPIAVGAPIVYDGYELPGQYVMGGKLYVFTGKWKLNGEVLETVPSYAANSYYRLSPVIETRDVYAVVSTDEEVFYVTSLGDLDAVLKSATAGATVTFARDITLDAPLVLEKKVNLDLAGNKLSVLGGNAAIVLKEGAAQTEIHSSVAGGKIESSGALFEAAASFSVKGDNLVGIGASLLKTDAALDDVQIDGGTFVLSGANAFDLGAEASLVANVRAVLIAAAGADVALIDSSADYTITLGGALCGIVLPVSEESVVILAEGLVLDGGVSALVGNALPAGVRLANETLVVASKKLSAIYSEYAVNTTFIVANKADVVLIEWEEDVCEYFVVGEQIYHLYPAFYDAKKFYTPNGKYEFLLEGGTRIGNVLDADFAGQTIVVNPCWDSCSFFVVAIRPDATFVLYENATNLSTLLSSGEFEDGTVFALGRKNMLLTNAVITGAYALDLNGQALLVSGTNRIAGGALRIFSSAEGASFYSDATQAFLLEDGALALEDVCYVGGVLADLNAASSLAIRGGSCFVEGESLYRAATGATVTIGALSANKQLFDAFDGYAWKACEEQLTVNGEVFVINFKHEEASEA